MHASHGRTYLMVFLILCGLTVVSVVADELHLANRYLLLGIVLAIASAKAICVVLYFMHLKFERSWKYLILGPTIVLAASLPFALATDIALHYYADEAPQQREVARLKAVADEAAGLPSADFTDH